MSFQTFEQGQPQETARTPAPTTYKVVGTVHAGTETLSGFRRVCVAGTASDKHALLSGFFFGVVTCTCIPGFAPNQVSRTIDTEGKCATHWLARSSVWDSQLWRGEPHPARSGLLSGLCRSLRAGFLTTDNLGLVFNDFLDFRSFWLTLSLRENAVFVN